MKKILTLTILVAVVLVAGIASAQQTQNTQPQIVTAPAADAAAKYQKNLERWQQMTPEQREKIRERYKQWMSLTDEQKQRIRQNLDRFHKMQQDKRQAIQRAVEMMGQLQGATRESIEKRMNDLQQMPPERRHLVVQKLMTIQAVLKDDFAKLRDMPPGTPEARQLMMQMHFKARVLQAIPPETIDKLKNMSPEDRHEAIKQLLAEHKDWLVPQGDGTKRQGVGGVRPGPGGLPGERPRRIAPITPDN